MRIITGSARGKRLVTLEGASVRPTTDRVKEALFNILQFRIEGRRILDLFAGSGQIGLEALSRDARSCTFVEKDKSAQKVLDENIKNSNLGSKAKVYAGDFVNFLNSTEDMFDIAYIDPPYNGGLLNKALALVVPCMSKGGIIVCEHSKDETPMEESGDFKKIKTYKYGKIYLTTYEHKEIGD